VPLAVVGEVVTEGMLAQERTSVSIEAEATHLPAQIEVSIEGLPIGTQVTAGDLKLPAGSTLAHDPDQVLLIIQEAPTAEQIEAEMAEAADELGIVEDQPDDVEGAAVAEAPAGGESSDGGERAE
jgi:large subunit ribosomal protein L25